MNQKIFNIFAVTSLALSGSLAVGVVAGIFYVRSDAAKEAVKSRLMELITPDIDGQMMKAMPDIGNATLDAITFPSTTGPVSPKLQTERINMIATLVTLDVIDVGEHEFIYKRLDGSYYALRVRAGQADEIIELGDIPPERRLRQEQIDHGDNQNPED